jgi:hypothetical protein
MTPNFKNRGRAFFYRKYKKASDFYLEIDFFTKEIIKVPIVIPKK